MKTYFITAALLAATLVIAVDIPEVKEGIPNTKISQASFVQNVMEVAAIRERRRVDEMTFLKMMQEPGVVILDARSQEKFQLRHIRGAVNLSLPDFTVDELAKVIPTLNTKVLIYCNNNFEGSPKAFSGKMAGAALNLHTFTALHTYGYTNIQEMGPVINVNASRLPFAGVELLRP